MIDRHSSPFATPSQCLNSSDIWYGSSSHRISVVEVRSTSLLTLLGWHKPLPGRSLVLQLLSLQQGYQQVYNGQQYPQIRQLQESMGRVFQNLVARLQTAFEKEGQEEIARWVSAAKDKEILWVEMTGKLGQGRFIRPSQLAFSQQSTINMEPFLYLAHPDQIKYKELFLRLGCKERFEISDLADLTRRFYDSTKAQNIGHSTTTIQFVVGIVQLIHRMVTGGANENDSSDFDSSSINEQSQMSVTGICKNPVLHSTHFKTKQLQNWVRFTFRTRMEICSRRAR